MQKLVEMVFDAEAEAQSRLDAARKTANSRRIAVEAEISTLLEKTRAEALAASRVRMEEARLAAKKQLEDSVAEYKRRNIDFAASIDHKTAALIQDLVNILIQTDIEPRNQDA